MTATRSQTRRKIAVNGFASYIEATSRIATPSAKIDVPPDGHVDVTVGAFFKQSGAEEPVLRNALLLANGWASRWSVCE